MIQTGEFVLNNLITILRIFLVVFFLYILIKKSETLCSRGYKYIRLIEYEKAIEEFNEKLKGKSKKENSLYGIAHCYYMLGLNVHAIKNYKMVIENNPNWGEVYFLLALLIMEEHMDFIKAKEYLEKGEENQKKHYFTNRAAKFQINEIKGWIFYLHKDFDKALKYYDLALPRWKKYLNKINKSFYERFAPVCYRIGIIFKFKGEIDKAKEYFEQSIHASPPSIFAKRSQEALIEINKLSDSLILRNDS